MLILGDGGAGKTNLIRSLLGILRIIFILIEKLDESFIDKHIPTDGANIISSIDIQKWKKVEENFSLLEELSTCNLPSNLPQEDAVNLSLTPYIQSVLSQLMKKFFNHLFIS